MKLLAISGSARRQSTNTALLKAMAEVAPACVEISVFHLLHKLPVFSPDLEGEETPTEVVNFMKLISAADGIIISSPEYVRAIPGGLKNAIDWMVSRDEIIRKPVSLLHASHRGDDMLAALRLVLKTVTEGFEERHFLRFSLISKSQDEVREFLRLPENANRLSEFISQFAALVRQRSQDASE